MRGYRVFDVIEDRYSDKDFFIDKDGKLYVRAMYFNHEPATRATVTTEEVDPSRYIVEEGTTVEGKQFFVGDVCEDDPDEPKLEIGWCDITAKFTITQDNVEYGFDNYNVDDLEVVGTIHDNPELKEVTE